MLDRQDEQRLRVAVGQAMQIAAYGSFGQLVGDTSVDEVADEMTFDHVATLVFPDSVDDVRSFLAGVGFRVTDPIPSKVVRGRLADRYHVSEADLDVSIVHGRSPHEGGGGVEVFALARTVANRLAPTLVARERATDAESHMAWTVTPASLEKMWRICCERLAMCPDGGGYNEREDVSSGGRTVLYFKAGRGSAQPNRVELTCPGHHPKVLAAHEAAKANNRDEHSALLSILAGHWAARAVHVAADIGLADLLHEEPLTAGAVASRTGCDPAAIGRLLRYLTSLGVLDQLGEGGYITTGLGELLRSDNAFSDLIRVYGGEFYEAWGEFGAAVRTGKTAFSHRYAMDHFEYFAHHPAAARTFDRSMQAVTRAVAAELSRSYPFPPGATIVDVGGGNGTLLRAILRAHPTVTGILFDRDHVSENAMAEPDGDAYSGRLHVTAGDFFTNVPAAGDVYVLSRVLHDWSDEDCDRVLSNCRRVCEPGTTLLVLERLLPEEGADSSFGALAAAWDMQMLAITGGRERDRGTYEKLLLNAGFRLNEVKPLPVDMNLLIATAS